MGKAQSKLSFEEASKYSHITDFKVDEVQKCYSTFSKDCPNGLLTRDQFLKIYAQYFPFGESAPFASLVFRMYDPEGNGNISFERYIAVLSIAARGRIDEKIRWAFDFYDQDQDGVISRTDLAIVLDAVHRMMCTMRLEPEDSAFSALAGIVATERTDNPVETDRTDGVVIEGSIKSVSAAARSMTSSNPAEQVLQIFESMCGESEMFISLDEFRAGIRQDPARLQGLLMFDGMC